MMRNNSLTDPDGTSIHWCSGFQGMALVKLPDGREFEFPARLLSRLGVNPTVADVLDALAELD